MKLTTTRQGGSRCPGASGTARPQSSPQACSRWLRSAAGRRSPPAATTATGRRSRATALAKAKAAALAETGGGKVTGTEVGDEESYYEVEVTKADGSQVDVQLNKSFTVVGSKDDGEDGNEGGNE